MEKSFNVLFVCTANSARSIMAEALLNILGRGRFQAFSAGNRPRGGVHPLAIEQIKALDFDYPLDTLRSKGWPEFLRTDMPVMDCIITVCNQAAGEVCEYWPGHPVIAHWGFDDPAAIQGSDEAKRAIFNQVFRQIMQRVDRLTSLPVQHLDPEALRHELQAIGNTTI